MKVRNSILLKVFSIFTGLLFLNLSFMLTELKLLGLDQKNSALYKNLVQLISLSGFEEESDSTPGTSTESQPDTHLFFQFVTIPLSGNSRLISIKANQKNDFMVMTRYREIYSPPPES